MRLQSILKKILLFTCLLSSMAYAYDPVGITPLNMPRGVTPISNEIYTLHMTVFWICVAIGVGVFGVMFYSLIMHRKSRGVAPATFHGNLRIEILWTVIPFIILIIMAIPATRVLMQMSDTSKADINIKVTGSQWRWQYEYLDEGISFYSNLATPMDQIKNKTTKGPWYLLEVDHPLVLPVNKKIRFLVTSNDVIHAWWVPELGIKRDAIPGYIYESWARIQKPGIYRGVCAELCGMNHAYMPIVVDVRSQEDYDKWVKEQKSGINKSTTVKAKTDISKHWTPKELVQHGEEVYNTNCAMCHRAEGTGMPPSFPSLIGSKIVAGPIAAQIQLILNGKNAMPSWRPILTDDDIAAVISYQRNSWGNNDVQKYGQDAGKIVMPADVAAQRGK